MEFFNDIDELNYLMTSEFTSDDLSTEEFIYLLNRFKYFYRLENSKVGSIRYKLDHLMNEINICNKKIDDLENSIENEKLKLEIIKNKKLTFKERMRGKIIE